VIPVNLPRRASAPEHAVFYFDFADPYCYIAAMRVPRLTVDSGAALTLMPVDARALGGSGGMTGPQASESLRDYLWRDVEAAAKRLDLPFRRPDHFPFDSRLLLCSCLLVRDRSGQEAMQAVAESLWHEVWERGANPEDQDTVVRAGREVAIPESALRRAHEDPGTCGVLSRFSARASQRGVFTVPTVDVEGVLYSGYEEMAKLEQRLRGEPLDASPGAPSKKGDSPDMPDWTFSG
jgi:2-hydroxychromene-2-carboxylate isomerase